MAVINLLRRIRSSTSAQARRIRFNVIVGVAGAASGVAILCIAVAGEVFFGIPANFSKIQATWRR